MAATSSNPAKGSISKVNDDFAIGEDLGFQRRWWAFERTVWIIFAGLIVADLLGCFGRGPLAKANLRSSDGSIDLQYERIERFSTPSIMTVHFGPNAIHDGKVQLWVSESVVKQLGNQRVVPQPVQSAVGEAGILYTFAATTPPTSVEFALEPTGPGVRDFALRVPGAAPLQARIWVVP